MYCCPGEAAKGGRPKPLVLEGIQVPLTDDKTYGDFVGLLNKEQDTVVRATIVGIFFSGKSVSAKGSTWWRGYGHMGCCSLLAIERVEKFEPHTRDDLDYTAEAGWYQRGDCEGGGMRWLRHISLGEKESEQAIREQRLADSGLQKWAFDDPRRVAVESLKPFYPNAEPALKEIKQDSARIVFEWKHGKQDDVIVVTKPYWLSFYANTKSVAWVSTTIKEGECY
jgi:hypothetical protein